MAADVNTAQVLGVPTRPDAPADSVAQRYPPPRLGRWSVTWRYGLCVVNYLISGGVLALVVASVRRAEARGEPTPFHFPLWMVIVDLVVSALMFVPIRWRRRYPVAITVLLNLASVIGDSGSLLAVWAYASLCTRRRWREVLIGLSSIMVSLVLTALYNPVYRALFDRGQATSDFVWMVTIAFFLVYQLGFIAIITVIGFYTGARRDLVSSLRERAETAEREQELRVLQGQAAERNRIAREMHDVLAHRMSLVSMHAGALAYRKDLSPDETREVATIIQTNAHSALEELRSVLGTLRADGPSMLTPEKPQPTMDQIQELVDDVRAGGENVDFQASVDHPELLPTQIGRHAYRILQEGITNARKHAPHAKITILMAGAPGQGLSLSVSNPVNSRGGTVPGAKVGLVGLAERVAVTGGTIHHGFDDRGNFVLEVWLPW